jgi:hypothetical protein
MRKTYRSKGKNEGNKEVNTPIPFLGWSDHDDYGE